MVGFQRHNHLVKPKSRIHLIELLSLCKERPLAQAKSRSEREKPLTFDNNVDRFIIGELG